ncbi:hypothetical protein [uncultured Friedmanniella sp.]|uniref:hypothetical protein n=1 Tax=uncultured Friedmanniella sp. TaxID=335381 RepID=UPI0035CC4197
MAWWPWRGLGGEPTPAAGAPHEVAPAAATEAYGCDWAELAPVQRVLEQPVAPVAPLDAFRAGLATSRDPSFLAPLGHAVDPSAGGLAEGIAGAVPPRTRPVGPELAVPPRPSVPPARVQRRIAGGSTAAGATPTKAMTAAGTASEPAPEAVSAAAAEPDPQRVAAPTRVLAAVAEPPAPARERPALPLAELPVVGRRASEPLPSRPAPSAGVVAPAASREPATESAPLSGFAAAIAAIGGEEQPAATAHALSTESGHDAPFSSVPASRASLTSGPVLAAPGGAESVVPALAMPGPVVMRRVGPDPIDPGSMNPTPTRTGPTRTGPTRTDPTRTDTGVEPPSLRPTSRESVDATPATPDHASDDLAGALDDQPLLGAARTDPSLAAAPSAVPDPLAPGAAEPKLTVVSRSVDRGAARPLTVARAVAASSTPTLGTPTSRPLAIAPPVTGSPGGARRLEAAAVQPLRFVPVGAPASAGSVRPTAVVQRVAAAPTVVGPDPGLASSPPGPGTPPPAVRTAAFNELASSVAPAVVPPRPVVGSSASFAQMFSAGTPAAEAGRTGPMSVPLQRRVDVDEVQVVGQPDPAGPAAADPPGDPVAATNSNPSPGAASAAPTGAGAGAGASGADLEELAHRLYEPLSARLRAELWIDRERAGV